MCGLLLLYPYYPVLGRSHRMVGLKDARQDFRSDVRSHPLGLGALQVERNIDL